MIQYALLVECILFSANKGQRESITSTESQDIVHENVTLPVKQGKGQGMIPQPYYNNYFFQILNDLLFKFAKQRLSSENDVKIIWWMYKWTLL